MEDADILATILPVAALATLAALLGLALKAAAEGPGAARRGLASADGWAVAFVAGLVLLDLALIACQAAGIAWRRTSLAVAALVLLALLAAVAAWRRRPGGGVATGGPGAALAAGARPGLGEAVAALALAGFAAAVWTRWPTLPDFVYHWGIKGKRYHLAGGVDYAFLADPLRLTEHPDYPNLLPSLYAATAHVRGFFDERSMLLWSVLFLVALVVLGRAVLARGLAPAAGGDGGRLAAVTGVGAGTACLALVTVTFAAGYRLAGGADLLVALGVVLALPALLRDGSDDAVHPGSGDLRVGVAAALVAGAKIEGVALAAILVAARLWATGRTPWRRLPGRLPRLALPPLALVVPWAWAASAHGLFRDANTGHFDLGRLPVVAAAMADALSTPEWHGLAWLLVALPLPLALPALRPAAAALAAQLGFYLFVYLGAQAAPRFYVLSSFPRLVFHLLPALLLLLWLALARELPGRHAARAGHTGRAAAPSRAAPFLGVVLLAGLATGCGGDDPVLRYDDLVTDRAGMTAAADDPRGQDPCADASPYSRSLAAGEEIALELDVGREPVLVLGYCAAGEAERGREGLGEVATGGALWVRAAARDDGAPRVVRTLLEVEGTPSWRRQRVDLAPLSGRRVRLTLRSALTEGETLHLRDAYVEHLAGEAAGWPRSGVHVEAEETAGASEGRGTGPGEIGPGEAGAGGGGATGREAPVERARGDQRWPPGAPDVLLVSLDTLRADVLEARDHHGAPLAPALDRFAAEGQVFDPHYAGASWTKPSHATLLTGYPLSVHGMDVEGALPAAVPSLAERLRDVGYATGGLVHDCVWLNPKFGLHRGFEDYRSVKWETGQEVRAAVNWIAARKRAEPERPVFFFLHSFEPHSDFARLPYEAAGVSRETVEERFGVEGYGCRDAHCASGLLAAIGEGRVAPLPDEARLLAHLYGAGAAETDADLGLLFFALRRLGLWDDLLVIVTSDHGEMLLEHGATLHGRVFEEVVRVPLLVKWPRSLDGAPPAGSRVEAVTSSLDVAATVAALAGVEADDLPGIDLRRPRAGRPAFVGSVAWTVVVSDGWKAVFRPDGNVSLRHLETDPREMREVSAEHPGQVARLRALLDAYEAWSAATRARLGTSGEGSGDAELTPEEEERLRALGYLR